MFGRKERVNPIQRELDDDLENLRDDCVAIFLDSGLTQKELSKRGGPTPATISKWIYRETKFPQLKTVQSFLLAMDYHLVPTPDNVAVGLRKMSRTKMLGLSGTRAKTKINRPPHPKAKRP